jgi:hypothetical protein
MIAMLNLLVQIIYYQILKPYYMIRVLEVGDKIEIVFLSDILTYLSKS